MEEKDDMTCGREGDGHPFTQLDLQDKFITPIMILRTYIGMEGILIFGYFNSDRKRK